MINSPNILRLSSVVLASFQELNSCSCRQDLYCNKFYTQSLTVQTQDSMCALPGIRMLKCRVCMIKIFRGEGMVDGVGGSSESCLKWGGRGCGGH